MRNRLTFALMSFLAVTIANILPARPIAAADAPSASTRPTPIDAADKQAIHNAMAHEVIVAGKVSDIRNSESVTTIVLDGTDKSQFNAVVLQRNREAVEKAHGEGLKPLVGKQIQIKGALALYRDKPQIVVSSPGQITIVDDSQPKVGAAKDAKDAARMAIIQASNKTAIDAALPQAVIVKGTVDNIGQTSGTTAINFKGTDPNGFYAVVLSRNREAVEKGHGAGLKSLVGKKVQVSGKIVDYRGRPEIVVAAPEQITVVEN